MVNPRWDDNDVFAGAYLEINEVPTGFNFDLKVGSGAHTGGIEGTAIRQSKTEAVWKSNEDDAQVRFSREGDKLVVETENTQFYRGIEVVYDGTFHRGLPQTRQKTLVQLWALKTPAQESAFIQLVGRVEYYRFVFSFQIPDAPEDLDGFGAKVAAGSVRGLFGMREAIIMSDPGGRLWAAVLDDDQVRYFTNDPTYAKKLPQTIEKWREDFREAPVIFMNTTK